jgi:Phage capsid family
VTESPGQEFYKAYADDPAGARVGFDYTITEAFMPTKERPRVTVRNLLTVRPVDAEVTRFWQENRPPRAETAGVDERGLRQEATFVAGMASAGLHPVRAWVRIPDGLAEDPDGFAEFIDYRLLVRLATAENQALTLGEHGILNHPALTRLPYRGDFVAGVLAACNEIEQNGATAHAMIVNPYDWWYSMLGKGILTELAANGTLISRTRMIAAGHALVGDFAVAARLLDGGRSEIRVEEPPPGTFATPGPAVVAEIWEGLAIHLPTHFFSVVPVLDEGWTAR